MKVLIKNGQIISPGEAIASFDNEQEIQEAYEKIEGTYIKGKELCASIVSKASVKENNIRLINLKGVYMPYEGDYIIGKIIDVNSPNWYFVDLNCPYEAGLHIREASNQYLDTERYGMTHYFNYGDVIFSKIQKVSDTLKIDLTMKENGLRKLEGGVLAYFNPSKFARILGKNDSMIDLIQEKTGTKIFVGMNGVAWISGKAIDIKKAKEAIETVDSQGHMEGLTKDIDDMLKKKVNKK
ncbi:MAG: KH domain-containing protein [Candidatus Nanoarchaeia archaeon]|nr:KH domain-containing protein [Candidatus Nanoarchaeia archaeon]MDD5054465.1 KH domain-containing protein [Candidatus Nanoarchaeia archaeon]MDD5499349.1 KH domain-containing protein [Candidatus Nanoarchaeia archaeon]